MCLPSWSVHHNFARDGRKSERERACTPPPTLTRLGRIYHHDGMFARMWPLPLCVLCGPPTCVRNRSTASPYKSDEDIEWMELKKLLKLMKEFKKHFYGFLWLALFMGLDRVGCVFTFFTLLFPLVLTKIEFNFHEWIKSLRKALI